MISREPVFASVVLWFLATFASPWSFAGLYGPGDLDRNGNGGNDLTDVDEFWRQWSGGDPNADFDHNGSIDGDDLGTFVAELMLHLTWTGAQQDPELDVAPSFWFHASDDRYCQGLGPPPTAPLGVRRDYHWVSPQAGVARLSTSTFDGLGVHAKVSGLGGLVAEGNCPLEFPACPGARYLIQLCSSVVQAGGGPVPRTTSGIASIGIVGAGGGFTDPVSASACRGGSATFTTLYPGSTGYQWQREVSAGNYSDLSNGSTPSGSLVGGASSAVLVLSNVQLADFVRYRCRVTTPCGSVFTAAASLNMAAPPLILTQPLDGVYCAGTPATLSLSATGATSYQWFHDGVPVVGASGPILDLSPFSSGKAGAYQCTLTNACGMTTSRTAIVGERDVPPTIFHQSADVFACLNEAATLSVEANGTSLHYQWSRESEAIDGAVSSVLTISPLQMSDFASYTCEVSNSCASATSPAISIVRRSGPAITSHPNSIALCAGAPLTLTVEAVGAETYDWVKDGRLLQSGPSNSYSIASVATSDFGFYLCTARGPGACGAVTVTIGVSVFETTPRFFTQPQDVSACVGQMASFSVVSNSTSLSWFHNGTAIPGAHSSSLVLSSVSKHDAGFYYCVASDFFCGTVFSDPAQLLLCVADVDDGSGTGTPDCGVTIDDLLYFLFAFEAGDLGADVDDGSSTGTLDGGVTIDDLLYFLLRFEAGC